MRNRSNSRSSNILRVARANHGFGLVAPLAAAAILLLAGALVSVWVLGGVTRAPGGADASARAAARAAIGEIESCNATRQDYRQCTAATILSGAGLRLGTGPGRVVVAAPNATSYTVLATSAAPGPRRAYAIFAVYKSSGGMQRSCSDPGMGGCDAAGRW